MYLYFSTIIVEESNVHTNIASQGIEKEKWTSLTWTCRELNRQLTAINFRSAYIIPLWVGVVPDWQKKWWH